MQMRKFFLLCLRSHNAKMRRRVAAPASEHAGEAGNRRALRADTGSVVRHSLRTFDSRAVLASFAQLFKC